MKYKSRAHYMAECEALRAENIELNRVCSHLRATLAETQFDARNMQAELTALRANAKTIQQDGEAITFSALQLRCKRLNANGVPAMIHRGHVIHQRTRAVIQPNQFGAGT